MAVRTPTHNKVAWGKRNNSVLRSNRHNSHSKLLSNSHLNQRLTQLPRPREPHQLRKPIPMTIFRSNSVSRTNTTTLGRPW